MTNDEDLERFGEQLEEHEVSIKDALESFGILEDRLHQLADDQAPDSRDRLKPVGEALKLHATSLEDVVESLNGIKGQAVGGGDEPIGYERYVERSRHYSRQEKTPGNAGGEESQDG